MVRIHERAPHRLGNTLGFFMQGLPAIFVQTEIAFAKDSDLKRYMTATVERQRVDFTIPEVRRGCEVFLTHTHELRHIHDALLSLPLFKLFLLQNARLWSVLQLPNHISGLSADDLPLELGKPMRATLTTFGEYLVNKVLESDRAYLEEQRALFRHVSCLGKRITLVDLLESNAIVAELLHLTVEHGTPAAGQYYERLVRYLPPEYKTLLHLFLTLADDFVHGMVALHLSITSSLYGYDDPISKFTQLVDEYSENPEGFCERHGPDVIGRSFYAEAAVEKWVTSHVVISDPEGANPLEPDESLERDLITFPRQMYSARRTLITKYVEEFKMVAQEYFYRTNELPLPPVVFWPGSTADDGRSAVVVNKEDLKIITGESHYVIRGSDDEEVVVAGIVPYIRREPFISYEIVDLQLLAYHWYTRLFRNDHSETYHPLIDELYDNLFAHYFVLQ
jgi:hypothetical protein